MPRGDAEAFVGWLTDREGGSVPAAHVKLVTATAQEEQGFAGVPLARPKRMEVNLALNDFKERVRNPHVGLHVERIAAAVTFSPPLARVELSSTAGQGGECQHRGGKLRRIRTP